MSPGDAPSGPGRWLRAALWPLVVLALVWGWLLYAGRVDLVEAHRAPQASPLVLADGDGRPVRLADYRGSVVVVNVWASWCGPCRAEIRGLSRVYDELRSEGLQVLGLNLDDGPASRLAELSESFDIRYPVVRAPRGFSGTFPNPARIPHSWFVDRRGRLRGAHTGYLTESALRAAVRTLLDEPA